MKRALFLSTLFLSLIAKAQTVDAITVSSNPLNCQPWTITVNGMKPMPQFFIAGDSYSVSGSTINVTINFDAPPIGNPMFAPYTHTITIPANSIPAGSYNLIVTAFSLVTNQQTGLNSTAMILGSCCPASADFNTNSTTYCWDESILITDLSAGATSVDWYVNNVLDHSGAGDFTLSGLSGSINILQVVSDGACSDSAETTINVSPMPSNGFNVLQSGSQFTFTATGSSVFSYSWDFGDGSTATGPLVTHTYSSDGIYNACLTSMNSSLCSADSCNSVTFSSIGLEESETSIRIYPNPASRILQIEGTIDSDIRWFNQLGQEFELNPSQASNEFLRVYNVSDLPAGIYYLQWSDQAEKVVIQ